jgi:hypothetical protein
MSLPKKILVVLALLVGVGVLGAVARHYQLRSAVNRCRTELKAKGVRFELPTPLPALSPEQDSTADFYKAVSLLTNMPAINRNPPPAMRLIVPGKYMIGAQQPDIRSEEATNSWEEAQSVVDQHKEALSLLCGLCARPKINFQIEYEKGFIDTNFLKHACLAEAKTCACLLASSAMIDLHKGNGKDAVVKTRAILALANAMQDQRTIIGELVRVAVMRMAQTVTWEILQSDLATDADLVDLQNDWQHFQIINGYKNAMEMEWIVGDLEFNRWRNSNAELEKYLDLGHSARVVLNSESEESSGLLHWVKLRWQIFQWRYWWSYSDELQWLQGNEVLREAANSLQTNSSFVAVLTQKDADLKALGFDTVPNSFDSILTNTLDFHYMLSSSITTLSPYLKKAASTEAARRMTVTAIALKRYHMQRQRYPDRLSDLPGGLTTELTDPADGKSLRYSPLSKSSFQLYSIGEDGIDDNGNPSPHNATSSRSWLYGRDWVWPQPETLVR